ARPRGLDARLRLVLAMFAIVWLARAGAAPVVTPILSWVPLIDHTLFFRYATPGWLFALIVLAAFALDEWWRREKQSPVPVAVLCLIATGFAVAAAWPLVAPRLSAPAIGWRPVASVAGGVAIM